MAMRGLIVPLLDDPERKTSGTQPTTSQADTKSPATESKPITLPAARPSGIFSGKVKGCDEHSPENIKQAYQALIETLQGLHELPDPIKKQLTYPDANTVNFNKIYYQLDSAIADEEFYRLLLGLLSTIPVFGGVYLGARGLTAGIFALLQTVNPSAYFTVAEAAKCGWQISCWPATIPSFISSFLSAVGCCWIKGDTEKDLIELQRLIKISVEHIQQLEKLLDDQLRKEGEERMEPEKPRASLGRSAFGEA